MKLNLSGSGKKKKLLHFFFLVSFAHSNGEHVHVSEMIFEG